MSNSLSSTVRSHLGSFIVACLTLCAAFGYTFNRFEKLSTQNAELTAQRAELRVRTEELAKKESALVQEHERLEKERSKYDALFAEQEKRKHLTELIDTYLAKYARYTVNGAPTSVNESTEEYGAMTTQAIAYKRTIAALAKDLGEKEMESLYGRPEEAFGMLSWHRKQSPQDQTSRGSADGP